MSLMETIEGVILPQTPKDNAEVLVESNQAAAIHYALIMLVYVLRVVLRC
jgi:hypothetical protein